MGFRAVLPPLNYQSTDPQLYSVQLVTYNRTLCKQQAVPFC